MYIPTGGCWGSTLQVSLGNTSYITRKLWNACLYSNITYCNNKAQFSVARPTDGLTLPASRSTFHTGFAPNTYPNTPALSPPIPIPTSRFTHSSIGTEHSSYT